MVERVVKKNIGDRIQEQEGIGVKNLEKIRSSNPIVILRFLEGENLMLTD